MANFVCDRCGRAVASDAASRSANTEIIKCACGAMMVRQSEDEQNEMRDMDNELGRDE